MTSRQREWDDGNERERERQGGVREKGETGYRGETVMKRWRKKRRGREAERPTAANRAAEEGS